MALKARLATLDGLDEAIKALYRKEGEAFQLDVETVDGYALEDVRGLTSALGAQKTEVRDLKARVAAFEGIDPVEAVKAIAKVKEFGTLDPKQKQEEAVKTALEQQQTQFNTQIAEKDKTIGNLTTNLETVMIDNTATSSLAAKKGNIKLLLPHVKSQVKVVKNDDGTFRTQVVDAAGHGRIIVQQGQTRDMTVDDLINEMSGSDDFKSAFDSTALSGGGTQRANGNGGGGDGKPKVVSADDASGLSASLEDIASGKAVVHLGTDQPQAA